MLIHFVKLKTLQKIFKTQLYEKIENYASDKRKAIEKRIQEIEAEATRHIRNLKQENNEKKIHLNKIFTCQILQSFTFKNTN